MPRVSSSHQIGSAIQEHARFATIRSSFCRFDRSFNQQHIIESVFKRSSAVFRNKNISICQDRLLPRFSDCVCRFMKRISQWHSLVSIAHSVCVCVCVFVCRWRQCCSGRCRTCGSPRSGCASSSRCAHFMYSWNFSLTHFFKLYTGTNT